MESNSGRLFEGETPSRGFRAAAIAAAAAHDLNDELTIVLSGLQELMALVPPGAPGRRELLEARTAAQRMAWKVAGLLQCAKRLGARPSATTLEALLP